MKPVAFTVTVLIFVAMHIASAASAPELERRQIEQLIATIATLEGAQFIRNGQEYEAGRAADHLRMKLKKAGARVQSADDFIRYCATGSSVSGQPYQIRFADGRVTTSEEFLRRKLAELRAASP